jgi:hypothetical protein
MFCQAAFDQWRTTIMQHLPHLSTPQATVLALWSFGMVLARSCALTAVSHLLAKGMKRKEQTVRQQLREWYDEVPRKRGPKRQALQVETCFPVLLGWVVSWWQGTQLALAIDATALGTRFVVLAVSVVYRGCALPVAWVVWPANTKHAWRREWLRLLRRLRALHTSHRIIQHCVSLTEILKQRRERGQLAPHSRRRKLPASRKNTRNFWR